MDDLMEILIEVLRDKGEARERREAKTLMLECRYSMLYTYAVVVNSLLLFITRWLWEREENEFPKRQKEPFNFLVKNRSFLYSPSLCSGIRKLEVPSDKTRS